MAEVGILTTLVKSLIRDEEESREAVGLLLDLSELPAVHRRIGRIQGCIVMLVALLNGDDSVASRNAGKLLNSLSSNTQNALHMAEAGYFMPLVQYLKEGDRKILNICCVSFLEFYMNVMLDYTGAFTIFQSISFCLLNQNFYCGNR